MAGCSLSLATQTERNTAKKQYNIFTFSDGDSFARTGLLACRMHLCRKRDSKRHEKIRYSLI